MPIRERQKRQHLRIRRMALFQRIRFAAHCVWGAGLQGQLSRTLPLPSTTNDILITDAEMSVVNSDSNAAPKNETELSVETRKSLGQLPSSPSNALSITGNTPYHVETYNLTAGSAGYVKLTATQNYNCSVFTTGTKDTYIEVYRQLPNGQWGHKPGTTTAKNTDCSNYIIYYPNSCDRDGSDDGAPNYTEFLGWYEIKTPTSATAAASSDVQDGTLEVTYPVKYNLTIDMIKELTRATSYEVAMTILGDAHRYYGSGMIGNVYELIDGTEIIVYFSNGYIDQIRTVPVNGEYEIIVD